MRTANLVNLVLAVLALAFLPLARQAAAADDAVQTELKKLAGKWKAASTLKDGEELDVVNKLGIQFTFKDDALEVTADNPDFTPQKRVIKLDTSTNPKLMDIAEKAEEFKNDKVIEGLYSLDSDTLKWCFMMDGDAPAKGKRPGALESKAASGVILITLKRVKD